MPKQQFITTTFKTRDEAASWLDRVRAETQGKFTSRFKLDRLETALPLPAYSLGLTVSFVDRSFYWARAEDTEPTHTNEDAAIAVYSHVKKIA